MKEEEMKEHIEDFTIEISDFITSKKGKFSPIEILIALSMVTHASKMAFLVSYGEKSYESVEKLIKNKYEDVRKDLEQYKKEKVSH